MQYDQNKKIAFVVLFLSAIFLVNACTSKNSNKNLVLEGTVAQESGTLDPAFVQRQKRAEENFFGLIRPSEEETEGDDHLEDTVPFMPHVQALNKNEIHAGGQGFSDLQIIWPTTGKFSSLFGSRKLGRVRRMHTGIDISAAVGTPIHAAADGQVLFSGRKAGYGYAVILAHDSLHETLYGHMSKIAVRNGQFVQRNQIIGFVGKTGRVTGANLHFETRINGIAYNPIFFLPSGQFGKMKVGMKTPSYSEQLEYYNRSERVAYVKQQRRTTHRK